MSEPTNEELIHALEYVMRIWTRLSDRYDGTDDKLSMRNGAETAVIKARSAVLARMQPEWQPIETCPSDGSPIWVTGGVYTRHMVNETGVAPKEADGDYFRSARCSYPPTHWMKREVKPDPPATAEPLS